jgi:hypothetical protein
MNSSIRPSAVFYMIHCKTDTKNCYYARGLGCIHIPFQSADTVQLQKITIVGRRQIIHNFFSAFVLFQKQVRLHVQWFKRQRSIRHILQRETKGP